MNFIHIYFYVSCVISGNDINHTDAFRNIKSEHLNMSLEKHVCSRREGVSIYIPPSNVKHLTPVLIRTAKFTAANSYTDLNKGSKLETGASEGCKITTKERVYISAVSCKSYN